MNVKYKKQAICLCKWFAYIVLIVIIVLSIRIFVLASFLIPSPSMEPAIISGDHILVNKLILGPRIYKSFDFSEDRPVEISRIKGFGEVKRNDVLVFNEVRFKNDKMWMDINVFFVKRCVGIPGDTIKIINGIYQVNNLSDTLGYFNDQLALSKMLDEIFQRSDQMSLYPADSLYNWSVKDFGPLYIPKAGDKIDLNAMNLILYRRLIEYESKKDITVKNDSAFSDNEYIGEYTFSENYYFMAGDKVLDSADSRYWGLLPEDFIVGKAVIIWKSKDRKTGEYRFNRFLKSIK